jgi:FG-GAP-like repeat
MPFALHKRLVQLSVLLAGCMLVPAGAAAQISFPSHQVTQNSNVLEVDGHGDFNGDGREDLMVNRFTQTATSFTATPQLYLSNGNGTYQSPKTLPAPVGVGFTVIGDFNHDGKLDFVTTIFSSSSSSVSIVLCLGNGDGTFQAPKKITSASNNLTALVAADLNHDNNTDLVELVGGPTNTLQLWISNGNGSFTKGQTIAPYNPPSSGFLSGAVTGDFDGDGKPDIAVLYSFLGPTSVQIWYGDGAGHLGSPFLIKDPNEYDDPNLIAADIENTGRSSLISSSFICGADGTSQFLPKLAVFSGNANRTLTYSNLSTNQCAGPIAVADFNGDGRNDLAYSDASCTTASASNFVIRPGTGSGGFGAEKTVYQNLYRIYQPYAIRTTTGTKPDLLFAEDTAAHNNPAVNPPEALVSLSNESAGSFPSCGMTGAAEGVRICAPGGFVKVPSGSGGATVRFSIGAAGPTAMRTVAIWIGGKKYHEQLAHAFSNYSFLDASISLSIGTNAVSIIGTGWDNTLQKKTVLVNVASCSPPSSPGINVCAPVNGSTIHLPLHLQASAMITGSPARIWCLIDGRWKVTSVASSVLDITFFPTFPPPNVGPGKHRFDFFATNTAGTKWQKTVYATLQ